jgi:uncharacterized membrane protein SpoIIM required for sporulation
MPGHETVMFLFDKDGAAPDMRLGPLFLQTLGFAAFSITAGALLFPTEASLVGVFLIALGQSRTVYSLLDRNRDEIWNKRKSPRSANLRLAMALSVIFAGIFVAYGIATLVLPEARAAEAFARQICDYGGQSLTEIRFDGLGLVFGHNAIVALVGFLFAILYRHGGLLLVLAWNASVWGVVFPWLARTAPDLGPGGALVYLAKTFLAIMPHLAPEAFAYILIATSGVFLSKALVRYELGTERFRQSSLASMRILGLAVAILALASLIEVFAAPALIAGLF